MSNLPQPGELYYHFKHDASIVNDHAYHVVGIGRHTETEALMVIYTPLYNGGWAPGNPGLLCVRPLSMWQEVVEKPEYSYSGSRFSLITDIEIIKQINDAYQQ
jgi:hypothetical protein